MVFIFVFSWYRLLPCLFCLIFSNRENPHFVQYVKTAKPNVILHNQSYMLLLLTGINIDITLYWDFFCSLKRQYSFFKYGTRRVSFL